MCVCLYIRDVFKNSVPEDESPQGYGAVSFGVSSPRRVFPFTSLTMKMEAVDSSETSPIIYHMA